MHELIEKLQKQFNLSPEQSQAVIKTVADFVKEKFPMAGSAMDGLLKSEDHADHTSDADVAQAVAGGAVPTVEDAADKAKGFMEGLSPENK